MPAEDETDEDQVDEVDEKGIRSLRKAADAGRAAIIERDTAVRELAFLKAGIPTETPLGKLFVRGYDGETTAEAIRAAAAEAGIWQPEGGDAQDAPTGADKATDDVRRALTGSGVPAGDEGKPTPDPRKEGLAAFRERRDQGDRREEAASELISRMIDAAAKGDGRVLL